MCKVLKGFDLYTYHIVANHIFEEQKEITLSKTGKYIKARMSSEINYLTLIKNDIRGNWQKEVYIPICRENMTFTI